MELHMKYVITLLLISYPVASYSLYQNGFRVELSHVDSKSNITEIELLNRAIARAAHRFSRLTARQLFSTTNISSTVHRPFNEEHPKGDYLMDLAIGNPRLNYSAILDTGSDLIWTQCQPCKRCVFQPTPIYDPSKSTTVSSVQCNSTLYKYLCDTTNYPRPSCLCSYNYTYAKGWTSGTLKRETFTFGTTKLVSVSNTVFGCSTSTSDDSNGTSGLVGFSRGQLSLPKQLNTSMFSYCLVSFPDVKSKSTLFIGPLASFSGPNVKSTPFVKNPSMSPMDSFYYLSLLEIYFGTTKLSIQPSALALQSNGTGGLIIDSGSTITSLVNEAYQAVENAVASTVKLPRVDVAGSVFNLCYNLSSSTQPTMPNMTLHFQGADMVLPVNNYMMKIDYLWCLAMTKSGSEKLSVLGNYQQQNFHILYDLGKEVLSFSPVQCNKI